jgi:L-lactate utilization protein LutC
VTIRERILGAATRACSRTLVHPGPYSSPTTEPSASDFGRAVREAGGKTEGPVPSADLPSTIRAICRSHGDGPVRVAPDLGVDLGTHAATVDPNAPPTSLDDTHVYVARGLVGVCENGAVALPLDSGALRAAPLLCEHLVLVLGVAGLVSDLHAGFARLLDRRPDGSHIWISGPSKTADIEELVFGAHGPGTLTVVLVSD